MKPSAWVCSLVAGSSAALAFAAEIPIVGIDKDRKPFVTSVPADRYQARLTAVLDATDQSLQPALERTRCKSPGKASWNLRTVAVGVSAGVGGGLGPIVNASAEARVRLVYTNSLNPVFPD